MSHKKNSFTLIEVLLALFITAILITILGVVFNTGLRAYRQGKDLIEITKKGQLILGQITKELKGAMVQGNVVPFVGIDSTGADNNASDDVRFIAPIDNSGDIDLCGIKYSRNGNILNRLVNVFNKGNVYPNKLTDLSANGQQFCDAVTMFNLRYRSAGGGFSNLWNSSTALPEIVEVSVMIQGNYPRNAPAQTKQFTTWIYLPNSTNN